MKLLLLLQLSLSEHLSGGRYINTEKIVTLSTVGRIGKNERCFSIFYMGIKSLEIVMVYICF